MGTVRLPSRGQPVDITYLLDIANGVNDALERVSTIGSNSLINSKQIETPKLRFYASKASVSLTTSSDNTTQQFVGLGFSEEPVVTASFITSDTNSQSCYAVVTYVDKDTCTVKLVVPTGVSGNINGSISIIAVGKTSTS